MLFAALFAQATGEAGFFFCGARASAGDSGGLTLPMIPPEVLQEARGATYTDAERGRAARQVARFGIGPPSLCLPTFNKRRVVAICTVAKTLARPVTKA